MDITSKTKKKRYSYQSIILISSIILSAFIIFLCCFRECQVVDCKDRALSNSSFCYYHTCEMKGCTNIRSTVSYCESHSCKFEGCIESFACKEHVVSQCAYKDCKNTYYGAEDRCGHCHYEGCEGYAESTSYFFVINITVRTQDALLK